MGRTSGVPGDHEPDERLASLSAKLEAGLSARTRLAFTTLLTEDVHWGGERPGLANECSNREQAGDHYASLLDHGLILGITDIGTAFAEPAGDVLTATMQVTSPDPEDFPAEVAVRLTVRGDLICDIRMLDTPADIEVLFFEGCPHVDSFLPHLRELLAANRIRASIRLTRVETDEDVETHQFLGSPSVRVDGRDIEPNINTDHPRHGGISYGLRCRLYATPQGLTGMPPDQWLLNALIPNPVHEAAVGAIHNGDVAVLKQILAEHPGLASTRLARHDGRTPLHIATDWPGHYPNVAEVIAVLVAEGADPDIGCQGDHSETPLHWAASSNDIAAIDALLDAGANVNSVGAVIGGGTPMADATAFGQWDAAYRLLERGADVNLFEAAALGLVDEVRRHLDVDQPNSDAITSSFWGACHGGHPDTAAILLEHGATLNWVGYDGLTPLDAAKRAEAPSMVTWLERRGATSTAQDG